MAIRIRLVKDKRFKNGQYYKALCAAKSKPKKGDIYLDDNIHQALSDKFFKDFKEMKYIDDFNYGIKIYPY